MNVRRRIGILGFAVVSCSVTTWVVAQSVTVSVSARARTIPAHDPYVHHHPPPGRPVDLVICLDTSGSMQGLIDTARAKLWDVVNELVSIEPNARLRVGLLTYGSPHNSTHSQGWIVRQSDLSSDLDSVYAHMMSMRTNGGDEFVGWVLSDAVHTLNWSRDPTALRLIYVTGNESADQCSTRFNFRDVARTARRKGIVINAIYAGANASGVSEHWDQVAAHGGGDYFAIDQDAGTVQFSTPHDRILIELNAKLNATYVPFGDAGRVGKANQVAQDQNAESFGQHSIASRAQAKASGVYRNERWDLVDAAAAPEFELDKVKEAALPAEMKVMTTDQRRDYIVKQRTTRTQIQRQIKEVSKKRETVLRRHRAKSKTKGLDDALRESVRNHAG